MYIGHAICSVQRVPVPRPAGVAAGATAAEPPRADALCGVRSHAPLQTRRPPHGTHVGGGAGRAVLLYYAVFSLIRYGIKAPCMYVCMYVCVHLCRFWKCFMRKM